MLELKDWAKGVMIGLCFLIVPPVIYLMFGKDSGLLMAAVVAFISGVLLMLLVGWLGSK